MTNVIQVTTQMSSAPQKSRLRMYASTSRQPS